MAKRVTACAVRGDYHNLLAHIPSAYFSAERSLSFFATMGQGRQNGIAIIDANRVTTCSFG